MAESQSKRQRDEVYDIEDHECDNPKRHKSYNHILSILEQEEDEPNQDLSNIFTSLQDELSSDPAALDPLQVAASSEESDHHQGSGGPAASECSASSKEDDRIKMMRHLLEASDDELGIPSRVESGEEETNSGEHPFFSLGDGLWEFEDDAANYYALLQSELFM